MAVHRDDEEDGEWEAPMIRELATRTVAPFLSALKVILNPIAISSATANPVCEDIGCGEWTPPMIANPNYKGKWRPPTVPNPDYQVCGCGIWGGKKSFLEVQSAQCGTPV